VEHAAIDAGACEWRKERRPMARATVLVVERDPAIRKLLRDALEAAGYAAFVDAGSGAAWPARTRPDLILLDADLTAAGGILPAVRLRLHAARIPVVGMTTAPPGARASLADAWLAKPFRLADLYAAVARWIGQPARSA
jgi:two-component system, OmpR family, KDP operon response regulator KdpE